MAESSGGAPRSGPRQSRHLPAFILLRLAQGPAHGGALHQALQERGLPKADPGAIYRALQHLETAGEVAGEWDTQHRGAARRVYQITPVGRKRLADWATDIEMRAELLRGFLADYADLEQKEGRP